MRRASASSPHCEHIEQPYATAVCMWAIQGQGIRSSTSTPHCVPASLKYRGACFGLCDVRGFRFAPTMAPHQAFRYDIKRLIAVAKEAKLRNSAPIKYQIEIASKYWETIFRAEGITDRTKMQDRANKEKQRIIDFLTGAENAGKVWFSTFYISPDGKEQHDVVINKIDNDKEGGDWETDIQEAVNMVCFTMRVHSNLVGSVPGKAQSNNSGSDKRELYTIAQALQKPYHDMLFRPHQIIIRQNKWLGAYPETPFVMLTTLDQHQDAKQINPEDYADTKR